MFHRRPSSTSPVGTTSPPDSFTVLDGMEKVTDPDGKSYFLMPPGTSGEDARKAALMTYILNCGTDYGENPQTDFPETPYSADEVQRIIDRQNANAWSYNRDVDFVHDNGGRLMTTPNGMLMGGLGGNQYQDMFSEGGGSTWGGDIFMVNIDDPSDPAQTLRDMVDDGVMWYPTEGGEGAPGNNRLDLDRILHHEEIHSQQWQQKGYLGFIDATSPASSSRSSPTIRWRRTPVCPTGGISDPPGAGHPGGLRRLRLPRAQRAGARRAVAASGVRGTGDRWPVAPVDRNTVPARRTSDGAVLPPGPGGRLQLTAPPDRATEFEFLTLDGPYPGGLAVTEPLADGFDWRAAKNRLVDGGALRGGGHHGGRYRRNRRRVGAAPPRRQLLLRGRRLAQPPRTGHRTEWQVTAHDLHHGPPRIRARAAGDLRGRG